TPHLRRLSPRAFGLSTTCFDNARAPLIEGRTMRRLWLALGLVSCSAVHPLLDTNVTKRRETALLLGEEPELARISLPFLLRAMSDVDPEVRWRAEFALGRAGPDIVLELAEALHGPDAWA